MKFNQLHLTIIIIIIALSSVHFWVSQQEFEEKSLFVNLTLIASITVTLGVLTVIFKGYEGAKNIRTSFLFLFLSYASYLTGEILWFTYETVLEVYPYPSLADVGFFFYFIFISIFLISTIRCFSTLTRYDLGAVSLIISIITAGYLVLMIESEVETFDLTYGLVFIMLSSAVGAFGFVAVTKLKGSSIGLPWIIILVSLMMATVADVWYYTLENIGVYTYDHILNTLYITSDGVLIYALILHKKIL